ncbi:MAG: DUF1566 domain-containing protein [SAR324 cluster bacterium]|nr:DUF1566 domain-containing protein [SAR324 cluster bacterium]
MKTRWWHLLIWLFLLGILSCGEDPEADFSIKNFSLGTVEPEYTEESETTVETALDGFFHDSAAAGIGYSSNSTSGTTDSTGKFTYVPGERIQFKVGDILLGETQGSAMLTPVNLVENGTADTPAVANISAFLQTLDSDGDPTNGINISKEVVQAIVSSEQSINFNVDSSVFSENVAVQSVIAAVAKVTAATGGRQNLVPPAQAIAHLNETIASIRDKLVGFTVSKISGSTTEAGGTATFSIKLKSQPLNDVTLEISSSDTTEGSVHPSTLTLTANNFNAENLITVTGVDDKIKDGDVTYTIKFSPASSLDSLYNGLDPDDVIVVNTDDETAGVTVVTTDNTTTEAGDTGAFTVKLNSQPISDVTITVTSGDTTEGTVSPATLTFTSANYVATQTVTVTGVDDSTVDGNIAYSVKMSASSSDTNYNGITISSVFLTNTDDETAGFTISTISGNTTEAGVQATFTVKLNSQPYYDVSIPVSSSDTTEGTVSPSSLTFTTSNWNANQTVTVTGVEDSLADGSQSYSIVLGAVTSSDSGYNGLNPVDVSVTNTDNDSVGFTVSIISGNTTELGGQATFTVKLNSQPTADVTIPVSSSSTSEGTVSTAALTFTTSNWNTNQTVTVTGVDDVAQDGNIAYYIILGIVTSSDSNYNGLNPNDVSVTNLDNDNNEVAPTVTAASVTFTDTDGRWELLGGDVTISKASSESTLTHYVLYWGSNSTTKQSGTAITELAVSGSSTYTYTFSANTALPSTASYLLVYSKNTYGESASLVSVSITDMMALPDTGQTSSSTTTFGEDPDYLINAPSYTDNSNGTITDNVTGLMWQKENDNQKYTWSGAGSYCEGLTLGGYADWRLPTKKELMSIIHNGTYNPAVNTTYFPNTNSSYYWSSSTSAKYTSRAWGVDFDGFGVGHSDKTGSRYVRCVRGGQSGIWSLDYLASAGTVLDKPRGLLWQQADDGISRTWEGALSYCEGLDLGGYSDWRLPNIKELESITDDTRANPVINVTYFPTTKSSVYWSSSAHAFNTSNAAWLVLFDIGNLGYGDKAGRNYVRCVRGGQ